MIAHASPDFTRHTVYSTPYAEWFADIRSERVRRQ